MNKEKKNKYFIKKCKISY